MCWGGGSGNERVHVGAPQSKFDHHHHRQQDWPAEVESGWWLWFQWWQKLKAIKANKICIANLLFGGLIISRLNQLPEMQRRTQICTP